MATCCKNKLFIFGYLRQYETNNALSTVVPVTLYDLIFAYFPKQYKIYAIGKNDFNEFGLSHRDQVTQFTQLTLFSSTICHPMDISNSYRTYIVRDYNNGISYFGHIQSSPSFRTHFTKEKEEEYAINSDIKIISQGIMAKISIIATQETLTIYLHDKENDKAPKQYTNYVGMHIGAIFKSKIIKICCLMHEAIYLTSDGQIYYASHNSSKISIESMNGVFIGDIACGSWHSLLLSDKGQIYGFGKNMFGQLGFGSQHQHIIVDTPLLHPFLDLNLKFIKICCGALFSMFIAENGLCFLCGDNDEGQIGNGSIKTDVKLPYILDSKVVGCIVDGDCGNKHSVIINDENEIYCFGDNVYKQCIPYSNEEWFDKPTKLSKPDIGIHHNHVVERVITGVDSTLFIVCS